MPSPVHLQADADVHVGGNVSVKAAPVPEPRCGPERFLQWGAHMHALTPLLTGMPGAVVCPDPQQISPDSHQEYRVEKPLICDDSVLNSCGPAYRRALAKAWLKGATAHPRCSGIPMLLPCHTHA